ncbi:MAG: IS4 family transposase [Pyrinomonadaceae bacterium]
MRRLRNRLRRRRVQRRYSRSKKDFSRQRKLTFGIVTLLILRGHKMSLQNGLNKFFSALGKVFRVPTASAYSQARQKLDPEVFVYLRETMVADFYELYCVEGLVRKWRGHRVLACDGTILNVMDNPQTRAEYFVQTNQPGNPVAVQAQSCVLYDLLNQVVVGATLGTRTGEKEHLLEKLGPQLGSGDLLILDRLYADYKILAQGVAGGWEVVVRLPKNSFKESRALFKTGAKIPREKEITLICPEKSRAYVRAQGLPESLTVRVVRVELKGGTIEVLATTLRDVSKYPAEEFKVLYGWRWNEETFFDRIKNIFDVERFSGISPRVIQQDYFGVLFLATFASILAVTDQQALAQKSSAPPESPGEAAAVPARQPLAGSRQVNQSICYVALIERVVEILLKKGSEEKVLDELHYLFRTSPIRARPGRSFPRTMSQKRFRQQIRWQKYGKKIVA